jgi:hypothetical protein
MDLHCQTLCKKEQHMLLEEFSVTYHHKMSDEKQSTAETTGGACIEL